MAETVAVQFLRPSSPYGADDVAGFPALQARSLVDRGVAAYWPMKPTPLATVDDQFTGMDRAALIAFARDHLGLQDEPPADVSDDALRGILRDQLAATEAATPPAPSTPTADATTAVTPADAASAPADGGKDAKGK